MLPKEATIRTLPLQEWLEFFLYTSRSSTPGGDGTSSSSRIIVKCELTCDGQMRFSKVYRGGENKGENAELQLTKELKALLSDDRQWNKGKCHIQMYINKSPSIISAEQITQVFRQMRGKTGATTTTTGAKNGNNSSNANTFTVSYAHPSNYANQRALTNLHRSNIKLQVLASEDILLAAIEDSINNIRGLAGIGLEKLRGLQLKIDEVILKSAHYMLINSFMVGNRSLADNFNRKSYVNDIYVANLRQNLKKMLRSSSKNRKVKSDNAKSTEDIPSRVNNECEDEASEKSAPISSRISETLWGKERVKERKYTQQSTAASLPFHVYVQLFLTSDRISRGLRNKSIDGKWEITCRDQTSHTLMESSGFTLKTNSTDEAGISGINDAIAQIEEVASSYSDKKEIEITATLTICSLPEKLHTTKRFVDSLVQVGKVIRGKINIEVSVARIEPHNIPMQQILMKILSPINHGCCRVTKTISVLHVTQIIGKMIDDLQLSLHAFQSFPSERNVRIRVRENELATAMHLIGHSIMLSNNKSGELHVHHRVADVTRNAQLLLQDSMFQEKTKALREILKTNTPTVTTSNKETRSKNQ